MDRYWELLVGQDNDPRLAMFRELVDLCDEVRIAKWEERCRKE